MKVLQWASWIDEISILFWCCTEKRKTQLVARLYRSPGSGLCTQDIRLPRYIASCQQGVLLIWTCRSKSLSSVVIGWHAWIKMEDDRWLDPGPNVVSTFSRQEIYPRSWPIVEETSSESSRFWEVWVGVTTDGWRSIKDFPLIIKLQKKQLHHLLGNIGAERDGVALLYLIL